jgi:hypothetical protein
VLSLKLHSALSYHALLEQVGRREQGLALVRHHLARFIEGHGQADLVRACGLLAAPLRLLRGVDVRLHHIKSSGTSNSA